MIVGGVDEDGNKDPAMITFVYKTGLSNSLDGEKFKPARRNAKKDNTKISNELCSHTVNEDDKLCSHSSNDTCGVCGKDIFERTLKENNRNITCFPKFYLLLLGVLFLFGK